MKKSFTGFWIFYSIWATVNILLLVLAAFHTTSGFVASFKKFWPFTVGFRPNNFLELFIYLAIPLVIFFLYRFTNRQTQHEPTEPPPPL